MRATEDSPAGAGAREPRAGTLLLSHLLRAVLFGGAAGWAGAALAGYTGGWLLYGACLLLAGLGSWVLTRPMLRHSVLATVVLWVAAAGVFYALRPVATPGVLDVGESVAGYLTFAAVVAALGLGAFLGRAVARP
jgi:hypothetical protein